MTLFIHELLHLLVALILSSIFYRKYRRALSIIAVFLGTIFIDADHLLDYYLYNGSFSRLLPYTGDYFTLSGKVIVFLHGWEYVLLFLLAGAVTGRKYFFIPLAMAVFFHLFLDQMSYNTNLFSYFFTYRALNGFSLSAF